MQDFLAMELMLGWSEPPSSFAQSASARRTSFSEPPRRKCNQTMDISRIDMRSACRLSKAFLFCFDRVIELVSQVRGLACHRTPDRRKRDLQGVFDLRC